MWRKFIIAILPSDFSVLFLHVENLGNTGKPNMKKKTRLYSKILKGFSFIFDIIIILFLPSYSSLQALPCMCQLLNWKFMASFHIACKNYLYTYHMYIDYLGIDICMFLNT